MKYASGLAAVMGMLLFATACAESGAGGREVAITQAEEGCSPTSIEVSPGEKIQFVVTNESSHDVYEVEGIEGTKVEEFIIPSGKTRRAGFTVPGDGGTFKLKCYVPTGPSTIIELVAGDGGSASGATAAPDPEATAEGSSGDADTVVSVELSDYKIDAAPESAAAGAVRFEATNVSADHVHELAVLRVEDGEATANLGEIEDVPAGEGGALTLDLEPGEYELACLIVAGEAGSDVDHYEKGMKRAFTVTE